MEIIIRKGEKKDLPGVMKLVKELAEYEKAPQEVSNTLEKMEEDGFGKNPVFEFFVADFKGQIAGIALYYIKYSTWKGKCIYLEDIIVTEKMRGNKIGDKLFCEVVKVSKELNVQRMEWQVLNWNSPAINFYKKYDVNFDQEWTNCKLVHGQLQGESKS
ncbi:MAG: GNAT family N-acetyltransferase [Bacteroidota bacterium]|nr:GNAT family N-acetyltransferase [Bacteroidota bacterium]